MSMHNGAEVAHDVSEPQKVDVQQSSSRPPTAEASSSQPTRLPAEPEPADSALAVPPNSIDGLQPNMSVIGADLAISGQNVHVISKGKIRVEGKIQGDVLGTEVVIGDGGEVAGVVSGETVRVFGIITGTIRGTLVQIEAGAKVEGDVHHQALSIDARAQVDGRVRRTRDISELQAPDAGATEAHGVELATPSSQAAPQSSAASPLKGRLWG